MKSTINRLFGSRGIRSFSFWLTLWGVVCLVVWLAVPLDLDRSDFIGLCHLSVLLNPVSLALLTQVSSDFFIQYLLPFFHPFALYALGRFLDWLFLKPARS